MRHTSFVSRFVRHAMRSRPSVPPNVDLKVSRRCFAAVGLGGAAETQSARRDKLSRDLFETPNGATSRRSSAANGHGQEGITLPPDAVVHEKSVAEGDKNAPLKNLPSPFPGFGPRDSSEQEQVPFPPSPAVPEESAEGHDDDEEEEEVEVEGDIVVEIEEEGEEGDFNSRSSEEPPLFSDRASNSLSSLVQPIPSCYPVRIPTSGSDSPPFAFWRATATPQSKSTPTRESHETRCTGDVKSATASCLLAQVTPDLALSKGVGGRP